MELTDAVLECNIADLERTEEGWWILRECCSCRRRLDWSEVGSVGCWFISRYRDRTHCDRGSIEDQERAVTRIERVMKKEGKSEEGSGGEDNDVAINSAPRFLRICQRKPWAVKKLPRVHSGARVISRENNTTTHVFIDTNLNAGRLEWQKLWWKKELGS
jgi:hypothetical protein